MFCIYGYLSMESLCSTVLNMLLKREIRIGIHKLSVKFELDEPVKIGWLDRKLKTILDTVFLCLKHRNKSSKGEPGPLYICLWNLHCLVSFVILQCICISNIILALPIKLEIKNIDKQQRQMCVIDLVVRWLHMRNRKKECLIE